MQSYLGYYDGYYLPQPLYLLLMKYANSLTNKVVFAQTLTFIFRVMFCENIFRIKI